MPICGDGCLIQARICQEVDDCDPVDISQVIPFVEHDLHQQLLHKLRLMGMNAVFSLREQIKLAPHAVFGVLTGTGMYLPALPPPLTLEVPLPLIQGSFKIQSKLKKLAEQHTQIAEQEPSPFYPSHLPDFKDYGVNPPPLALPVFLYPEDQEKGGDSIQDMDRRRRREEANPQFVVVPDKQGLLNEEKVARLFENEMEVGDKIVCTIGSLTSTMKDFISLQSVIFLIQFKYESAAAIEPHVFRRVVDRLTCHLSSPLPPSHTICLMGLEFDVELIDDDIFQVVVTGMSILLKKKQKKKTSKAPAIKKREKGEKEREREREGEKEKQRDEKGGRTTPRLKGEDGGGLEELDDVLNDGFIPSAEEMKDSCQFLNGISNNRVILSHLGFVPKAYTEAFLGRVHLNLIREKSNVREGNFPKFAHNSLAEVQSIARAHVAGLGGNALVSLHFDCVFVKPSEGTKQGYVMITLSGDALRVRHQKEDNNSYAPNLFSLSDCGSSTSPPTSIMYPPSPRTPVHGDDSLSFLKRSWGGE
eukprot:CAMPEP_0201514636 /NCGR_PEP_ID=MMETSP0161_2-20130828/6424_1 /ASSEMBLY_ACC=CAM_ASM_000251 /TAXON_ID=180227 /ORGANISM="Neoparamoeba aestuarina, Strain SoJaBio B1-5/56/2" /LENGTH=530 /DNA_ID=CAMNT_0047911245 /DNA_START=234 /DNA_END=1826 /DNA_ORIENTATION=+